MNALLLAEATATAAGMAVDALLEAHLANPAVHGEDGVEALDCLPRRAACVDRAEGLPPMLLLDIKTQRMDGLEVLRQIRHRDPGVEACVVKPVDVDRFFPAAQLPGRFRAVLDETPDGD